MFMEYALDFTNSNRENTQTLNESRENMLRGPKKITAVRLFQDLTQQRLQTILEIRTSGFIAKSIWYS